MEDKSGGSCRFIGGLQEGTDDPGEIQKRFSDWDKLVLTRLCIIFMMR